jgi:uncharacterized protein (UPF0332 family)
MDLEEYFERGLLKKVNPSESSIKLSIRISNDYLNAAYRKENTKDYGIALNHCYSSIISAINAVMYNDGVEAWDFDLAKAYMNEKHPEFQEFVDMVDGYRKWRYSTIKDSLIEKRGEEEISDALHSAVELLQRVEKMTRESPEEEEEKSKVKK